MHMTLYQQRCCWHGRPPAAAALARQQHYSSCAKPSPTAVAYRRDTHAADYTHTTQEGSSTAPAHNSTSSSTAGGQHHSPSITSSSIPATTISSSSSGTSQEALVALVRSQPSLIPALLPAWWEFLAGWGLAPGEATALLLKCPELYTRSDVHTAGAAMLFFKGLGWSNAAITSRLLALYPHLLTQPPATALQPVLDTLAAAGCTPAEVRLLVWEVPAIFTPRNTQRYLNSFRRLGAYGLGRAAPGREAGPQQQQQQQRLGVDEQQQQQVLLLQGPATCLVRQGGA